jgi:hypothetical protein
LLFTFLLAFAGVLWHSRLARSVVCVYFARSHPIFGGWGGAGKPGSQGPYLRTIILSKVLPIDARTAKFKSMARIIFFENGSPMACQDAKYLP